MIEFIGRKELQKELQAFLSYLREYLTDPIRHIKSPPTIHWQTGIVSIFALNILFGIVRAIVAPSILQALLNFLITPFLAAALMSLITLFLVYFFQLMVKKSIPFRVIFTLLLIAYIPGAFFFFVAVFYPPLFILGVVVMSALVVVAFVENLDIPKKMILRLVISVAGIVLIFWIFQQIYTYRVVSNPKSLDQLEKEVESLGEM